MRKKLIIILSVLLVLLSGCLIVLFTMDSKPNKPVIEDEPIVEPEKNLMDKTLREKWLARKATNPDYIGDIVFESGIIDLPFVQAEDIYDDNGEFYTFYDIDGNQIKEDESSYACDGYQCSGNDVYLWTYWETMNYDKFDNGGSIFLDYRNTMNDENIIIYGHHFSVEYNPERDKAFTCLENFVNEEYYEDNKYIDLILDNEIRRYEIAVVFKYDLYDAEDTQYYRTFYNYDIEGNPDEGYADRYFKAIKQRAYYDTGVELKDGDDTLTLQTCYSGQPDYREVIVAKLIETTKYDKE